MQQILLFFCLLTISAFKPAVPSHPNAIDWNGSWSTNLGDMTLKQVKNDITGTSEIRGTITGKYNPVTGIVTGSWEKGRTKGSFSWKVNGTGAFTGTWQLSSDTKSRGEWNGTKIRTASAITSANISTREKNGVSWTGTWSSDLLGKVIFVEDLSSKKVNGKFLFMRGDYIRTGELEGTTEYGNYANTRKWFYGTIREGGVVTGKILLVINFHNGDSLDQFSGQCYTNTQLTSTTPFLYMPLNMRGSRSSTAIPDLSAPLLR